MARALWREPLVGATWLTFVSFIRASPQGERFMFPMLAVFGVALAAASAS